MVKLAFITLTNYGYLEYTRNLIKSLENIGVEGLIVYCLDNKSFNELEYDRKLKIENTEEEEIEDFYTFRSGDEWSLIMYNKFRIEYGSKYIVTTEHIKQLYEIFKTLNNK